MTYIPSVLTNTDNNNTSSTLLTSGSTFTGISTITTGYNTILLTIKSDVNSSSGGIVIQFSDDNITFNTIYTDTYFASTYYTRNYQILKKYYKIIYTNSSTNQTEFLLTSRLSTDLDSSATTVNSVTVFDSAYESSIDAFGKLRVSNPYTLLDLRIPGISALSGASTDFKSNELQLDNKSSGSYTGTYASSKCVFNGSGTGYYMTQSRNFCSYQPGKSLLFLASAIINPQNSTFTSRIGYFDSEFTTDPTTPTVNNGVFFEFTGGQMYIELKNNTLTSIPQSSWNIDKMDGTGNSGLNLDFTKTQLFVIDMEWLGVGRVRFGFYAYGRIQYCHQITNINILTEPYTNNINLPISHCLIGGTGSGSLTQICSTVISEGGYNPLGRPFSVSNSEGGDAPVTVPTTEVPLLAIRGGGNNYYHQNIIPNNVSIIDTATNNSLIYRLRFYIAGNSPGTITWTDVNTNYSVTQFAKSGNITGFTTANSIVLDQNYFYGRGAISFNSLSDIFSTNILQITANIDNVSDILVLTCQKIGTGSTTVYSTITWQELY